jgi:hypothetical protein
MKKVWALITISAIAVLSGLALSKFLKWVGQEEVFDFDLSDDVVE